MRFLCRFPCYKPVIMSTKERCSCGQGGTKIVDGNLVQLDQASAIFISIEWRGAIRAGDVHQMIKQRLETIFNRCRNDFIIQFRTDYKLNVKVSGIAMIITGLLEINAVGSYVPEQLSQQNTP